MTIKHINSKGPKPIQFTRWLLTPLGIWPFIKQYSTAKEIFGAIVCIILCYSIILFALVPSIFHIVCREKNLSAKIALCGPSGFFVMNLLKYSAIIYHRKDIKQCIEHVETDWQRIECNGDEEEWTIMIRNIFMGRKWTILCAAFIYTGGMSYHTVMPFLMASPASSVINFNHSRPLVFPGYDVLFNPYITPVYEIVYFSHCLAAMIIYTITTVSCNLAASFVTHASSQMEMMVVKLNCLVKDAHQQQHGRCLQRQIGNIVRAHGRVLK